MSNEITNQLIKNINYMKLGPREIIFKEGKIIINIKIGELGRNFYIILKGEVFVIQHKLKG